MRNGETVSAAPSAAPSLPPAGQWRMLLILTMLAMLASVDKHFIALIVGDIKRDLAISDVQIGLILGVAFAISNVAVTLPAGWLADRFDRRTIVGSAVALWSAMAMACGLAGSFAALFLARLGVGLGEGISPPASISLIRDGVPVHRRGRAFGIYSIGATFGGGLSFAFGGALLALIIASGIDHLPVIGPVRPWQMSLIVIGLVGLPLSLSTFAFPEPKRDEIPAQERMGFGATLRLMRAQRRTIAALLVYSVLLSTLTSAWSAWAPAIIGRTYGLKPQQIGPILGLILMIGAPLALVTIGSLLDRFPRSGARALGTSLALVFSSCLAIAPQVESLAVFWVIEAMIVVTATAFLPITATEIAKVMPSRAIGKTMAIFLLFQGAIGTGLGPVLFALIARGAFGSAPGSLNDAVTVAALALGALAAAAILCVGRGGGEAAGGAPAAVSG